MVRSLYNAGAPHAEIEQLLVAKAALVYVRGLDGSNGSPFAQYPRLAEQFELHVQQVSASPSASDASFDEIVEDVADALRRIARDSNGAGTVLMGESMGGVVVAGVAIRHPELVSGLILINPATSLSVMPDLQEDMRWILDSSIPEPLFPLALFAKIGWKTFDADLIAGALKDIFIEKKMEALRTDDPELAAYYDVALEALVAQLTEAKPSSFWRGERQLRAGCECVDPSCLRSGHRRSWLPAPPTRSSSRTGRRNASRNASLCATCTWCKMLVTRARSISASTCPTSTADGRGSATSRSTCLSSCLLSESRWGVPCRSGPN